MKSFRFFLLYFVIFLFVFPGHYLDILGQKKVYSSQIVRIKETGENIKLPPPLYPSKRGVKALPKNFPEWFRFQVIHDMETKRLDKIFNLGQSPSVKNKRRPIKRSKVKKKIGKFRKMKMRLDFSDLKKDFIKLRRQEFSNLVLKNYVVQKQIKDLGRILSNREESIRGGFLFPNQIVVVKLKNDEFVKIDDQFRIYRYTKEGFLFWSYYAVQILGTIRVVQPIGNGRFEARVENLFSTAFVGDRITSEPLIRFSAQASGSIDTLDKTAKIISSKGSEDLFLQLYSIVFLNRGVRHGLRIDQRLAIHQDLSFQRDSGSAKEGGSFVGALKVVHLQEKIATAVITEARRIVHIGDRVGLRPDAETAYRKSAGQRAFDAFNAREDRRGGEEEELLDEEIGEIFDEEEDERGDEEALLGEEIEEIFGEEDEFIEDSDEEWLDERDLE